MAKYYKATTKEGRVVTRCSTSERVYGNVWIPDALGWSCNFAAPGRTPPEAGANPGKGQLVPCVEISAVEYRQLKAAAGG